MMHLEEWHRRAVLKSAFGASAALGGSLHYPVGARLLIRPADSTDLSATDVASIVQAAVRSGEEVSEKIDLARHAASMLAAQMAKRAGEQIDGRYLANAKVVFDRAGEEAKRILAVVPQGLERLPEAVQVFVERSLAEIPLSPELATTCRMLASTLRIDSARLAWLEVEHGLSPANLGSAIQAELRAQAMTTHASLLLHLKKLPDPSRLVKDLKRAGRLDLSGLVPSGPALMPPEAARLVDGWVRQMDQGPARQAAQVILSANDTLSKLAEASAAVRQAADVARSIGKDGLSFQNASSVVGVASVLLTLSGNPKAARDLAIFGSAALHLGTTAQRLLSGGITTSLVTGGVFAPALSVLLSGGLGGPSSDQLMFEQLAAIRRDLDEIRQEIAKVNQALVTISGQIESLRSDMQAGMKALSEEQKEQMARLRSGIDDLRQSQERQNSQIAYATNYLSRQMALASARQSGAAEELALKNFQTALRAVFGYNIREPLTGPEWREASAVFEEVALKTSQGAVFMPRGSEIKDLDSAHAAFVASGIMTEGPWQILAMYADASGHLVGTRASSGTPANAMIWALGAQALSRLVREHDRPTISSQQLDPVIASGEESAAWLRFIWVPRRLVEQDKPLSVEARREQAVAFDAHVQLTNRQFSALRGEIKAAVKSYEENPEHGLRSAEGSPKLNYQVRLFTDGGMNGDFPEFDVQALDLPRSAKPAAGSAGPKIDLPLPDLISRLPGEYLLLEILLKRFGRGFEFEYSAERYKPPQGFDAQTSYRVEISVLYSFPGEAKKRKLLTISHPAMHSFHVRTAGEAVPFETWVERSWRPALLNFKPFPEWPATETRLFDYSYDRGLAHEPSSYGRQHVSHLAYFWEEKLRGLIAQKLNEHRNLLGARFRAALETGDARFYPEVARAGRHLDAAYALECVAASLFKCTYPRIRFVSLSSRTGRLLTNASAWPLSAEGDLDGRLSPPQNRSEDLPDASDRAGPLVLTNMLAELRMQAAELRRRA